MDSLLQHQPEQGILRKVEKEEKGMGHGHALAEGEQYAPLLGRQQCSK
jgi:hypothetical protein